MPTTEAPEVLTATRIIEILQGSIDEGYITFPHWKLEEILSRRAAPVPLAEDAELLRRGRECAVSLTGDPDDAAEIDSPEKAWQAIDEALAMGKQRCDELNELNMAMRPLAEDRIEAEKLVQDWSVYVLSADLVDRITTFAVRVRAEQRASTASDVFKTTLKLAIEVAKVSRRSGNWSAREDGVADEQRARIISDLQWILEGKPVEKLTKPVSEVVKERVGSIRRGGK